MPCVFCRGKKAAEKLKNMVYGINDFFEQFVHQQVLFVLQDKMPKNMVRNSNTLC